MSRSSPPPLTRRWRSSCAIGWTRHTGLHLAAFSSADAAAEHRRLAAAGFPVLPLVDMRRPVLTENGESEARFTIARIAPGPMPEGRTQFLTHHTEKLVWRESDLDHPNGAQALAAVWIAAAEPAEPAARFARFTGRSARREGKVTDDFPRTRRAALRDAGVSRGRAWHRVWTAAAVSRRERDRSRQPRSAASASRRRWGRLSCDRRRHSGAADCRGRRDDAVSGARRLSKIDRWRADGDAASPRQDHLLGERRDW